MSARVTVATPTSLVTPVTLHDGDTLRTHRDGSLLVIPAGGWVVNLPKRVRSVIGISVPNAMPAVAVRISDEWWNITGFAGSVSDSALVQRIRTAKDAGGYWKVLAQ